MSNDGPPMPKPTPEHIQLMEDVGRWNVACTFFMAPDQPPMQSDAVEVVEAVGDFWVVSRFESSFCGMPFVGRATAGFEPHTGKYVTTWIDCMAPALSHMTGTRTGDTLTMLGDSFSCITNSMIPHRMTIKRISANERIFDMYCTLPDGHEIKIMSNHYRRA